MNTDFNPIIEQAAGLSMVHMHKPKDSRSSSPLASARIVPVSYNNALFSEDIITSTKNLNIIISTSSKEDVHQLFYGGVKSGMDEGKAISKQRKQLIKAANDLYKKK